MKKIALEMLCLIIVFFTACGSEPIEAVQSIADNSLVEKVIETKQQTVEQEDEPDLALQTIISDVKSAEQPFINTDGVERVTNYYDVVTKVKVVEKELDDRYFIGRENYEENIGYFNKYLTEDAGKLYIKKKMYLPDIIPEGTAYCIDYPK